MEGIEKTDIKENPKITFNKILNVPGSFETEKPLVTTGMKDTSENMIDLNKTDVLKISDKFSYKKFPYKNNYNLTNRNKQPEKEISPNFELKTSSNLKNEIGFNKYENIKITSLPDISLKNLKDTHTLNHKNVLFHEIDNKIKIVHKTINDFEKHVNNFEHPQNKKITHTDNDEILQHNNNMKNVFEKINNKNQYLPLIQPLDLSKKLKF